MSTARSSWEPEREAKRYDDIRLKVLSYAILAPNPHNRQAWKIELKGADEILL